MVNYFFILLIGLLSIVATVISSKGGLYDRRFKWNKMITARGWKVVVISTSVLGLTIWQAISEKKEQDNKEAVSSEQKRIGDSTVKIDIQKGIERNSKKLFDDLSLALAKQNLRLDTVTKSLEKLRDSARTIVIKPPPIEPSLIIMSDGIKYEKLEGGSYLVKMAIKSSEATSKNINLLLFMELIFSDGTFKTFGPDKFFNRESIPKDIFFERSVTITDVPEFTILNIGIWGTYTDSENSKIFSTKEVYAYNSATKVTKRLSKETQDKFFERNNIIDLRNKKGNKSKN